MSRAVWPAGFRFCAPPPGTKPPIQLNTTIERIVLCISSPWSGNQEKGKGPCRGPGSTASARQKQREDRKSTRLNSSHGYISYAVFCLKKKTNQQSHKPAT